MCGVEVDDKYKFCMKCVQQMKKDNAEAGAVNTGSNADLIKSIGAVNNNLYGIRTILETMLEKEHKLFLVWDKKEAKFLIEKKKRNVKK
jgi:hypothetical protein